MQRIIFTASLMTLVAVVAGCDTALEGSYKSYTPESSAAVLWPIPDTTDAQAVGYREVPATLPSTTPADAVN